MKWQPLVPGRITRRGRPASAEDLGFAECWINREYVVLKRSLGFPTGAEGAELVHLSIRRQDRRAAHDWRHFQRIKNELCGPEAEGIELYPAESRLVDEANQYHMYVLIGAQWPVGERQRQVSGPTEAAAEGATQRPFE